MNPTETLSTRYAWYKQAAQHHPQGGQKQAPDVCISTRFYITQNFPLYICIHLSCPVKPVQYLAAVTRYGDCRHAFKKNEGNAALVFVCSAHRKAVTYPFPYCPCRRPAYCLGRACRL